LNSTVPASPGHASASAAKVFLITASKSIVKLLSMAGNPIELHVDLDVEPTKEKDLVSTFQTVFEPTISKQPGFVSVTLLKSRGTTTAYRLVISFETEEQRRTWVASDDHQRVWPQMEQNLKGAKFTAALWDKL
jgi:heme-degrading monooxygenase HmoA